MPQRSFKPVRSKASRPSCMALTEIELQNIDIRSFHKARDRALPHQHRTRKNASGYGCCSRRSLPTPAPVICSDPQDFWWYWRIECMCPFVSLPLRDVDR